MDSFDRNNLQDGLKQYYKRLFPFKLYCQWLTYGDSNYFQRREFAFVLDNDSYLRFKSYHNALELEKELQNLLPTRIELGAVYNYRPRDGRGKPDFTAVERELVFDIDLNDYDDIRKCCTQDGICTKCWQFITIAVKLIDAALSEDFGFDYRLWVYSGRRGIHCWVCDKAARMLGQDARAAIVDYLTLVTAGEQKTKKVSLPNDGSLHPSIARAVDIILTHFAQLAEGQGWFDDDVGYDKFLALITNEALKAAVRTDFTRRENTLERAQAIVSRLRNKGFMGDNKSLTEAVLQYAYPRLDVAVSKTVNHLLKTPFSVHPKTGKICVPLHGDAVDKFDLDGVPRVDTLYRELLAIGHHASGSSTDGANRKQLDYKRTLLAPHVRVFEEFVSMVFDSTRDNTTEPMDMDESSEK